MSIRVRWPFGLLAAITVFGNSSFTPAQVAEPVISPASPAGAAGAGLTSKVPLKPSPNEGPPTLNGRFGFGGPNPPPTQPIPVVSSYLWEINNATGTAGPTTTPTVSGWSLISVPPNSSGTRNGQFYWDASPTNKLTFSMVTLLNNTTVGQDTPTGPMANFDPTKSFTWQVVEFAGSYLTQDTTDYPSGAPTLASVLNASTNFDSSGFENLTMLQIAALNTPGNPSLGWNIHLNSPGGNGGELDLVYSLTPVPEPGTLVLTALGLAGVWRWRRAYAPIARSHILGGES